MELICAIGQIQWSLKGSESLSLANDFIFGALVENDVIKWKKKGTNIIQIAWSLEESTCNCPKEGGGID